MLRLLWGLTILLGVLGISSGTTWAAHCYCKLTIDGQEIQKQEEGGYNQAFG